MPSGLVIRSILLCLALAALAPAQQQATFVFSYVLPTNLNVIPLKDGGTITFPGTPQNGVAQAALNITNTSAVAGQVGSVTISGAAFGFSGLPLFPALVGADQTLQLQIRYQPSGAASDTGQVQVTFPGGGGVTFNLVGTLSAAKFVYTVVQGTQTTPVTPGATVPLPDTNVGETSSAVFQVKNAGNVAGTVPAIILNGADFAITALPALPAIVQPNAGFSFTLTFAPTQAVARQASLSVGTDTFNLTGKGLGPNLVFSYASGGATVKLGVNGAVVFSPIMISQSGQVNFTLQNTGTVAATIFNIGIGESPSPFSVSGLPALPLALASGAQSGFNIAFAPVANGFANGTLRLDSTIVPLIGSGTAPPPLPAYSFQGPSGNVDAASQPNVSLKLSQPYPIAIAGTLTLSDFGNLPNDPAVQFSTGGRTVEFTIAANATNAVFAGQGQQIQLQTGTVATTVTLTPSFATQTGGVNLTPSQPVSLQFTVAPAAPTLIASQVTSATTSSFVLTLSGFSTTRSLTSVSAQFTAAPGFTVPATPFNIDISQAAKLWFSSTPSVPFGGQFTATIPFTLQGTVSATQTLLQSIASVSVTIANGTGTSNTLQTSVP
ncbi:MAG: choice-of-anchor D domain-containing protein [Acidobacteriia bacterium]|nr:choice-of-anchor D domain-containing protein [Terriglobia bacterium]